MAHCQMHRVFIYALGSGMGHVTRAIALGNALVQRGHHCHVLASSELARSYLPWDNFDVKTHSSLVSTNQLGGIRVDFLRTKLCRASLARHLKFILKNSQYDYFLVDVFPRGILGEIPNILNDLPIQTKTVWIQRLLNKKYLEYLSKASTLPHYDLSFIPGESAGIESVRLAGLDVRTEPWILDFFPTARGLHNKLSMNQDHTNILWVASGNATECEAMFRLYQTIRDKIPPTLRIYFTSPLRTGHLTKKWPMINNMQEFDWIIGAAGYHLTYECMATHTPIILMPMRRVYDDQFARAHYAVRKQPENKITSLYHLTETLNKPLPVCVRQPSKTIRSGVYQAVDILESH